MCNNVICRGILNEYKLPGKSVEYISCVDVILVSTLQYVQNKPIML